MAITVTNNLTTLLTAESTETWRGNGNTNQATNDVDLFVQGSSSWSFICRNTTQTMTGDHTATDLSNTHLYAWILTVIGKYLISMQIYVEDNSGNWGAWTVADANSYPGGWQCYVVNTDRTFTNQSATPPNLANIVRTGFRCTTNGGKNQANFFVDVIRYGNDGLTITGGDDPDASGDPGDWEEFYQATITTTTAFGIIEKFNGIYFLQGPLTFGAGTGNNWFRDTSKVIVFKDALTTSSLYKITVTGGTGNNEFRLGTKAGTAGVNGCTITAAGNKTWVFDASSTAVENIELYGCSFNKCSSFLLPPNATGREVLNCSWNTCGPIDPSTCKVENFTISNATSDAVLINSTSHQFNYGAIINSTDAAIYTNTANEYNISGIEFINNTYDIQNDSTGSVTINNLALSNATTFNNTNGGSTTINTAVTLTVRGVKTGSEPTNYVRIRIERADNGATILNANASTTDELNSGFYKATTTYNYPGSTVAVIVKARYKGYIPFTTSGTITSNGLDITAVWLADPNFTP